MASVAAHEGHCAANVCFAEDGEGDEDGGGDPGEPGEAGEGDGGFDAAADGGRAGDCVVAHVDCYGDEAGEPEDQVDGFAGEVAVFVGEGGEEERGDDEVGERQPGPDCLCG